LAALTKEWWDGRPFLASIRAAREQKNAQHLFGGNVYALRPRIHLPNPLSNGEWGNAD
jgi:hypothetical protein